MRHDEAYKIRDDAIVVAAIGIVNYAQDLGNNQMAAF
jgi:hypothetical protein